MILVDTHPLYRRITLNRPDRLNALLPEMADAMIAALDEAQADEACRAVLLTGAGRGFCAGQDLTEIVDADPDDIADLLDSYHPVIEKIRELPLPVVAAVNGVAAGAGCNLALACDIVIAARSAKFRAGLLPDRPCSRLRRHLVSAAPRRHGARPRADDARRAAAGRNRRRMGHDLAGGGRRPADAGGAGA